MAISRMQQPRQNYGLGSFVKKVTRKVTKPFTKLAKKLVPKEIAGVMRAAAPFLPAGYREAAYLLGTAKQTGRISPIDLALTAAPTFFDKTTTGQNLSRQFKTSKAGEFLFGRGPMDYGEVGTQGLIGQGGEMFQLGKGILPGTGPAQDFGILDTKAGQFLLGGKEAGTFSKSKVAGLGVGVLSLISSAKTPQEAGEALASQTGNSDDYERGYQLFSQLKPELFQVPEQFRMPVKDGGRIGFREGTGKRGLTPDLMTGPKAGMGPDMGDVPRAGLGALGDMKDREFKFDAKEFMINQYKEDGTKPNIIGEGMIGDGEGGMEKMFIIETPNFGTMTITLEQYLENFGIPERNVGDLVIMTEDGRKVMNKDNKAAGGLMRTNFSIGGRDEDPKPLPSDPTEPVNPFRPKPIGPFPSKKASIDDPFYRDSEGDRDEHSFRMFNKPYKELNQNELEEFQEEMMRLMNKFSKSKSEGIMMAGLDRKEKAQMLADELAEEQFGMDFYDLDIRTQMKIYQIALDMIDEGGGNAMGGLPNDRTNFALGTKPTAQESGLGGLPIEADMRYTGGFMPYGAVEKADDVPARLSKNEFVFTADAVRAAGGGSVNEGARKMYQAMKQLEAKPEAKGMMA